MRYALIVSVLLFCGCASTSTHITHHGQEVDVDYPGIHRDNGGHFKKERFRRMGAEIELPVGAEIEYEEFIPPFPLSFVYLPFNLTFDPIAALLEPEIFTSEEGMHVGFNWVSCPSHKDRMTILGGFVFVYTAAQYKDWLSSAVVYTPDGPPYLDYTRRCSPLGGFGDLQQYAVPEGAASTSTVYRVDQQAPDGRVLQTIVISKPYTADPSVISEDTRNILRVVHSARFYK